MKDVRRGVVSGARPARGTVSDIRSRRPASAPSGRPPPRALPSAVRSGVDAVQALRAAEPDARPHHDLVEDQDDAAARRLLAQGAQERRIRVQHPARHRLDDHGGHVVNRVEPGLERVDVVPRQDDRLCGGRLRDAVARRPAAAAAGRGSRGRGRARRDSGPRTSRPATRPVAPRARRSACSVASVPELVKRTISADGSSATAGRPAAASRSVGAPKMSVPARATSARTASQDARVAVAGHQRAEGQAVVQVLAAVHVPHARALGARHVDRIRREELDVRGHAGRQALRRPSRNSAAEPGVARAVVLDGAGPACRGGHRHQRHRSTEARR